MSKDNIIEAELIEVTENPENLPSTEVKMTQVDAEFEYARANIVNLLQTSNAVLETTAELAIESEHPRMIEVYTGLVKGLADINKSLLGLREKKMKLKGEMIDDNAVPPAGAISQTNVTNNTIFVGSTDELMKSMQG